MEKPLICAVVVLYRPPMQVLANVERLLGEVGCVVAVDNTPTGDVGESIEQLQRLRGCTVLRNGQNLGIAAALNIGIRYALAEGFEWVILFDQDSRIGDNFIAGMLPADAGVSGHPHPGVQCPRYKDELLGIFLPTYRTANGDVCACMTSGSLIHANTFRALGMMDEGFFIDYVDLDFCLRVRAAGMKVIERQDAVLMHSLGRMTQHRFMGKTFSTTNHSAKRRYYITRNRFTVMRRYLRSDREWVIGDFKGMVKESIKILVVENDKLAKAGYMLRGLFDAVFNRMGPRVAL